MADTGFKTSGTITSTGAGTYPLLDKWDSPSNASTVNSTPAQHYLADEFPGEGYPFQRISETLQLRNFSASIPTGATIDGIEVSIHRTSSDPYGNDAGVFDYTVQLVIAGTPSGTNKADTATKWPVNDGSTFTEKLYGSSTDKWGLTPTESQINATDFGIDFRVRDNVANSGFFSTAFAALVDAVRIKIYYTESGGGTTSVEQSKTFSFNKRAYAEQSKTFSYNKKAYAEQSKTFSYNKRVYAEQSKTFSYNKVAQVEQSATFSYSMSGQVTSTSTFSYNKRLFVEQDKTFSYNQRTYAEQSKTFSYNSLSYVEQSKTFSYSMSGQVTSTTTFSYNKLAQVEQSKTFSYNALTFAEKSLTNSWNSKSYAEQSKTFSWSSRSYTEQSKTHSYNKLAFVEQSKTFTYNKLESSLTQVEQSYSFSYNKRLFVENSGTYSFNKRAYVEQQKTFSYSKLIYAEQSKTFSYNKKAYAEQSKTFSYNILANGSVTATFSHSYNISNYVFADLHNSWNIIQVSSQRKELPYMTRTILLSQKELHDLRSRPDVWVNLRVTCDSELDYVAEPAVVFNPDSSYTKTGTSTNELSDRLSIPGGIAYRAALCYQITGDEKYAVHAQNLIDQWSRTLRRVDGFVGQGVIGYHFLTYVVAADWVRGVNGWDGVFFGNFLKTKILPQTRYYYKNNTATWWSALEAGIYAYNDDYNGLIQTKNRWEAQMTDQLCVTDGSGACTLSAASGLTFEQKQWAFTEEIVRSGTSEFVSGTTKGQRGMSYTHFNLKAFTLAAEILLKEGINIYTSSLGRYYQNAFNKAVNWVHDPTTFPYYASNGGDLANVRQCSYFAPLTLRFKPTTDVDSVALERARAILEAGIDGDVWQIDFPYLYLWNPPA